MAIATGQQALAADVLALQKITLKSADETVNNSIVLQNDDELLVPVAANEIWYLKYFIKITGTDTADFKFIFVLPAGGAMRGYDAYDLALLTNQHMVADRNFATQVDSHVPGGTTGNVLFIEALYVGAGAAGNVQFQWAQSNAEASDTKVLANSFILAKKMN